MYNLKPISLQLWLSLALRHKKLSPHTSVLLKAANLQQMFSFNCPKSRFWVVNSGGRRSQTIWVTVPTCWNVIKTNNLQHTSLRSHLYNEKTQEKREKEEKKNSKIDRKSKKESSGGVGTKQTAIVFSSRLILVHSAQLGSKTTAINYLQAHYRHLQWFMGPFMEMHNTDRSGLRYKRRSEWNRALTLKRDELQAQNPQKTFILFNLH